MRLLLLTRNEIGGVLTYVLNFSKYLKKNNLDHLVILYEDVSSIHDDSIKEGNIVTLKFSKYSSQKSKFSFLKNHISSNDILILNDTHEIEFINHFKVENKSIYILHGDLIHYQDYLNKYKNGFDDIFCVSNYLKEKYKVIYPNYSFSIAHPMVDDYPIIENFTVSTPIKIVSIGRFEYLKGSDTIINTIDFLKKNKLPFEWTLFIPPSKNDEKLLKDLDHLVIVKQGFNNNDVLKEIEKMDILFFPSRLEGFSMSVIECLKRGVVVIARDIPMGIPEVIQQNANGIICKDEKEFERAIQNCIVKSDEILKMKYHANKSANRLFGYEKECKNLLELIISTDFRKNKKYMNVKLPDPKLPEYILRFARFIKYDLAQKHGIS